MLITVYKLLKTKPISTKEEITLPNKTFIKNSPKILHPLAILIPLHLQLTIPAHKLPPITKIPKPEYPQLPPNCIRFRQFDNQHTWQICTHCLV